MIVVDNKSRNKWKGSSTNNNNNEYNTGANIKEIGRTVIIMEIVIMTMMMKISSLLNRLFRSESKYHYLNQ